MIKNTASQIVGAQMVSASDGSAFTSTVTAYITLDGGTQALGTVGSGVCTHEGNGYHSYAPSQAETNGDLVAVTFIGTGAIPATLQIYTVGGDAFTRLGAPAGASVSADIAALPTAAENADAVWDEVLTGATHNVTSSAGRRLRTLQDLGVYEAGAIWVDTVNGTAGTVDYENGTVSNPVDTIADALTLAASVGLKHLHVINGSTITLPSSLANYEITGDEYGVALNGQSVDSASITQAHLAGVGVSGTFTGNPHILHSSIGAITGPNARVGWCALQNTITSNGTGTWVIHSCWGVGTPKIDFGAGAGQTIYVLDWVGGPLTIAGMAAGDVLYVEGRSGSLTIDNTNTAGTVVLAGNIALTNNGSGQTLTQTSRYELTRILSDSTAFSGANIAAILTDTAEIGAAGAGLTALATASALATVDTNVDTILAAVDTEVAAILAAVDTEVAAILALLDDARGEPAQGAPPVNPDLATKVDYLYKFARNKVTQTATTLSIYDDAGTTVDHKSTVSDDGTTYTRGELATGP